MIDYLKHLMILASPGLKFTFGTFSGRKCDCYFLSTGRCGTKLLSHILNLPSKTLIRHQPQPSVLDDSRQAVSLWFNDQDNFYQQSLLRFPSVLKKLYLNAVFENEIYGETYNSLFPFGYHIYEFYRRHNRKVKIIHLVRNPVDCGSSILRTERPSSGKGFTRFRAKELNLGNSDAEISANIWNQVNQMIDLQLAKINDPESTRRIKIEDMNKNTLKDLFDFLGIDEYPKDKISSAMIDESYEIRHSHQDLSDRKGIPLVTDEEKEIIRNATRPTAEKYGYG